SLSLLSQSARRHTDRLPIRQGDILPSQCARLVDDGWCRSAFRASPAIPGLPLHYWSIQRQPCQCRVSGVHSRRESSGTARTSPYATLQWEVVLTPVRLIVLLYALSYTGVHSR